MLQIVITKFEKDEDEIYKVSLFSKDKVLDTYEVWNENSVIEIVKGSVGLLKCPK